MIDRRSILGLFGTIGLLPSNTAKAIGTAALGEAKFALAAKEMMNPAATEIIESAARAPSFANPAIEAYKMLSEIDGDAPSIDYRTDEVRQSIDCYKSMSKSVKCVIESQVRRAERDRNERVGQARRIIKERYGLKSEDIWELD